ncbi:MAG TPA: MFS transporter [Steroidobacteraceae bacterium]|nr:MFS transporter [Steroidobacteraceae bacterium]
MHGQHRFNDGLATTLLICVVYPVGPAATILMPMFVGGFIDGYGYTDQQAANVAALEGLGLVVASIAATTWIRRVSWVRAVLASLLAYAGLNAVSAHTGDYSALLALRFLTGIAGGNLFAVTVAALGDNRAPDRAFGLAQAVQGVMMLAAFLAAPALLERFGVSGLYHMLAVAALLMLPTLRWLPAAGRLREAGAGAAVESGSHTALIWLGLAASVLFFVNVFGFWGFIERIGQAGGLPAETIGAALGVAQLAAIGGALAAVAASNRYGRYWPLLIVFVGQVLALYAVAGRFGALAYFASTGLFQALFIVGVSYQMGAIAELDTRGRFLVMMTAAQGLGAAIGPAVAAPLIGASAGYGGILWLSAALCLSSTLAFLFIVHRSLRLEGSSNV